MKMKIALLTCAAMMLAAVPAQAALMVTDGSFETETNNGAEIPSGSTTGGWDITGSTGAFTPVAPFDGLAAQDGTQFIQITAGGGAPGRISQLLGTTGAVPSDVTLAAYFSQRSIGVSSGYTFGLYSDAAGTVALAETTAGAPTAGVWTLDDSVTAIGVAAGTPVYAFFTATTPTSSTNFLFIDNVTLDVTAIPEPSSMLLVGLGVLGLGVVRRRRQR